MSVLRDPPLAQSQVIETCMQEVIEYTLKKIECLTSPVARSCHIGNNTSNVWGWLALARNTKLVQFDHTRYGLDENTLPWTLFGDRGRLLGCYDFNGVPQPKWIGRHVNEHLPSIDRRHFNLLNYQIRAECDGKDLLSYHYSTAESIARKINGSEASCDCLELISIQSILASVIGTFIDRNLLDMAFSYWVSSSLGGKIVTTPIKSFVYSLPGVVAIHTTDQRTVYHGDAKGLADLMLVGATSVANRFLLGDSIGSVGYPWFTLELSYFIHSVKEYCLDNTQVQFWHAGGSSSQYYVNEAKFKVRAHLIRDALVEDGFLPINAQLTIIPTFCCQLFGTTQQGVEILENIIEMWINYVRANSENFRELLLELGKTVTPFEVGKKACLNVDKDVVRAFQYLLSTFAFTDRNRLPVSHLAYFRHSHYNKFGAEQTAFLNLDPRFPPSFKKMRWAEAELLIKVIAQIYADMPE